MKLPKNSFYADATDERIRGFHISIQATAHYLGAIDHWDVWLTFFYF